MDAKTYQECALRTMADQEVILKRVSTTDMQLINGVVGLANEVGELADALKKHVEYGKPRDRENIKEEVGDCFWRLRQICDAVGLTFEECMQANIEKLKIRYPKEFSDIQAHEENRDREKERQAMEYKQTIQEIQNEEPAQNGQGWAEPPEEEVLDNLPPVVKVSIEEGEAKLDNSVIKRKPLNHSYTRYCRVCQLTPVHKSNQLCICTDCYMKYGETKGDK